MTSLFDAAINGTWLTEIDERVIVTDIREDAPTTLITTMKRPVDAGSFFVRDSRENLNVTLSFVIWERDITHRNYILNQIKAWSGNGIVELETNQRPDQILFARLTGEPGLKSGLRWMNEIQMTFTAFEIPFWQEREFSQVKTTENGSLFIPGTGKEARVWVEAKNTGRSTVNEVTLNAGDTWMWFDGIELSSGESLVIGYDERGMLKADVSGVSVLAKRTSDSDDDLLGACGDENGVFVSADGNVEAVFKARGVYV